MTAVEWLLENLISEPYSEEDFKYNEECWDRAIEMERQDKIEFACKVVEVSSEKYIQGKTTEQIAKELLTFKSE